MKKIISILTIAAFIGTMSVNAQEKQEKKKEEAKTEKKCSAAEKKSCSGEKKAGCCAAKKAEGKK
jgi:hypothetical protein